MIINNKHKEFVLSILGQGFNVNKLRTLFNEEFKENLTVSNFKQVAISLGIDFRRDNKVVLEHPTEIVLDYIKKLVHNEEFAGLTKRQIYDLVNVEYPCGFSAFEEIAKDIDWRARKGFKIKLDIE